MKMYLEGIGEITADENTFHNIMNLLNDARSTYKNEGLYRLSSRTELVSNKIVKELKRRGYYDV